MECLSLDQRHTQELDIRKNRPSKIFATRVFSFPSVIQVVKPINLLLFQQKYTLLLFQQKNVQI